MEEEFLFLSISVSGLSIRDGLNVALSSVQYLVGRTVLKMLPLMWLSRKLLWVSRGFTNLIGGDSLKGLI